MVGVRGFEPPTPASRTQYSTRLSYTPTVRLVNASVIACHCKGRQFYQTILVFRMRQAGNGCARLPRRVLRLPARVLERARFLHRPHYRPEIAQPALDEGLADERALRGAAVAHGANERQRCLALGQVIAQILSGLRKIARII